MSTVTQEERLERRISDLYATDQQFADARPSESVAHAIEVADVRLPQIVRTVLDGYADRPALGQRAVEFVTDPSTGRTSASLLPRFETITYRELSDRVDAVATALTHSFVQPGDRVAILGFTSVDYTTLDMALLRLGAVSVPLQTSAPVAQLRPIAAETEPVAIASSVDFLDDAVEVMLTGHLPERLVVFDYHAEDDDHREALEAATARLAQSPVVIETLTDVIARGSAVTVPPPFDSGDDSNLALLIYTSGSTGTPKGAMYLASAVKTSWRRSSTAMWGNKGVTPSITLNFMPMSHMMGRGILYATLGAGGTAYFVAKSDLSTLFEDLALTRPTQLSFVPRIWDMVYQHYQSEVDRRAAEGGDKGTIEADVLADLRENLLGGRFVSALTGSAPISDDMKVFVESLLDLHLTDGYGSTEAGAVFVDGQVQRPPVIDYKLVDVPDLGYFSTDRPYPRGELLVKSETMFPGYYKRPEITAEVFDADGYYRTGDIVAELGPDRLEYVDRRNNVLKLSQGEFVTVAKLEAVFGDSPLV
ncbi:AMP-binding protein, partial [Mycobacterium sp. NPDC048908]|uniref:AMP-binding protein n=1 Tax=Mycobacterium sp. NPDC048908 TaxID=3364292 RepID=UPI003716638A